MEFCIQAKKQVLDKLRDLSKNIKQITQRSFISNFGYEKITVVVDTNGHENLKAMAHSRSTIPKLERRILT